MKMVCEWLTKAYRDLRAAKILYQEELYEEAAFHAQQTAEKALKALLIADGVRPPKTHSIEQLLSLLQPYEDTSTFYKIDADTLTDYAVETRYPGPPIDSEDSARAIAIAEETVKIVEELIKKKGIEC